MLEKREKRSHSTTLYRVACEEILKFGHMIPDQMLALYKARDMNEVFKYNSGSVWDSIFILGSAIVNEIWRD